MSADAVEGEATPTKLDLLGIVRVLGEGSWHGRFTYSELDERVLLDGRPFGANELTRLQLALQLEDHAVARVSDLRRVVTVVAQDHTFHPVRDWIKGLAWDGIARLDRLLIDRFGADDTPLNRTLGATWLVGVCARVFEPGCNVGGALMLIASGGGVGAVGACAALMPEPGWAGSAAINIGSRDAFVGVHGTCLFELSGHESWKKAGNEERRAFVLGRVDRYRQPFDAQVVDHRRQAVLVATTSLEAFGEHPIVGPEWWTVIVGDADLVALARDRDQLFAEAFARFLAGEPWVLAGESATALGAVQRALVVPDTRKARLSEWVARQSQPFTVRAACAEGLGLRPEPEDEAQVHQAVGKLLARLGCVWARPRAEGGGRFTTWERSVGR